MKVTGKNVGKVMVVSFFSTSIHVTIVTLQTLCTVINLSG